MPAGSPTSDAPSRSLSLSPEIMLVLASTAAGHPLDAASPNPDVNANVWIDKIDVREAPQAVSGAANTTRNAASEFLRRSQYR
ncbi:hypothetical_protein [Leishmania braziliensis MHOM/BR/75/M2904]|uniref:Hypothetical_protein n=1 Tax=Leishmania braziliensis MHOM/BR/75/M2904 TaxID=420245 RepID=A0A3P3Z9Z4_LEIBR|nr:unnamed protein product [Leishmania braziliensis]SYZ66965.1 hypothetical_protein [Leishmania braziliensis MHOM/BR/75/M2904]CAJ2475582.1 unnamed protein product [Leishmania braziliensis]CAJ2476304.1 unnamed protein product [Leishmania braziliensis]CAJ2476807.1 unnamed protein product [Leishmania braziliensis]